MSEILAAAYDLHRVGQLTPTRWVALRDLAARYLSTEAIRLSGGQVRKWPEIAKAVIHASATTGIPPEAIIALVMKESGGSMHLDNLSRPGRAQGVFQLTPRYAPDFWPGILDRDPAGRARQIATDINRGAIASARWLLDAYQDAERKRSEAGERTYREHWNRHASLVRSKGGYPSQAPEVPTRWYRSPWLARYNRGNLGQWPLWGSPNRVDGSDYQLDVEKNWRDLLEGLARKGVSRTSLVLESR
jgi:hypothetical protein